MLKPRTTINTQLRGSVKNTPRIPVVHGGLLPAFLGNLLRCDDCHCGKARYRVGCAEWQDCQGRQRASDEILPGHMVEESENVA